MTEQEFQTFLRSIRPADRAAMDAAARRQAELAKPPGSLGALEDVSIRLAGLTGRVKNRIDRCRVLVFAADNGVTAEGVSATPSLGHAQSVYQYDTAYHGHVRPGSGLWRFRRRDGRRHRRGMSAAPEIVDRKIRRSTGDIARGARHDAGAGTDGHFRRHGAGASAPAAGRYAGRRHRRDGHRQHHHVRRRALAALTGASVGGC